MKYDVIVFHKQENKTDGYYIEGNKFTEYSDIKFSFFLKKIFYSLVYYDGDEMIYCKKKNKIFFYDADDMEHFELYVNDVKFETYIWCDYIDKKYWKKIEKYYYGDINDID